MGNSKSKRKSMAGEVPTSAMLQSLQRDSDAQFHLSRFLSLHDLVSLFNCCRSWNQWLMHPRHATAGGYSARLSIRSLLQMQSSGGWARSMISDLAVLARGEAEMLSLDRSSAQVMHALAPDSGSNLTSLTLTVTASFRLISFDIRRCLTLLGPSLHSLTLMPEGDSQYRTVAPFFDDIQLLHSLTSLEISNIDSYADEVNFVKLPQLANLTRFSFGRFNAFRCNAAQLIALVNCRRLTWIDAGMLSTRGNYPAMDADAMEMLITCQIPKGYGFSAPPMIIANDYLPFLPLQNRLTHLHLETTSVCSAVWEHLSKFTLLTELRPLNWRRNITPDQWNRLAEFKYLTAFRMHVHPSERVGSAYPLLVDSFLPSLLQCVRIVSLDLKLLDLSIHQLNAIVQQLPNLSALSFHSMYLDSVAPLASATRLTSLQLIQCSLIDVDGSQFRLMLPSLPRLERLTIQEIEANRITAKQAESLNQSLLQRMPLLRMDAFTQNLRV